MTSASVIFASEQFYTRFALSYARYAERRRAYLSAVEAFILREAPAARSLIDVGCGDGIRGVRIARSLRIDEVTLLDDSDGMLELSRKMSGVSVVKQDLGDALFGSTKRFDVVLCLWNVLGHVSSKERRQTAAGNLSRLVAEGGVLFLDVNNRYNAVQYGVPAVLRNMLLDVCSSARSGADFDLTVETELDLLRTRVHLFSPREIEGVLASAGLRIVKREVINYESGQTAKCWLRGQLAFKVARG